MPADVGEFIRRLDRSRLEELLDHALGPLSLDDAAFAARGDAVCDVLEGLDGGDVLWLLGTLAGSVIAQAPAERHDSLLVRLVLLARYALDRQVDLEARAGHA